MGKILAIDDDASTLRLLSVILQHEGHEITTATNGIEGLRIAQDKIPDLIVLDVMLPGIDGFEVCDRLKNNPATAQIPVLMISAKGQSGDRETGLRVGAAKYLVKPLVREEFIKNVQSLLLTHQVKPQLKAKLIGFLGSRSGVGTSTITANVAMIMAQKGHKPIIIELSLSFETIPNILGIESPQNITQVLETSTKDLKVEDIEAALSKHSSGVRVLVENQIGENSKFTPGNFDLLLTYLAEITDYILIDVPASLNVLFSTIIGKCNMINIVTPSGKDSANRVNTTVQILTKAGIKSEILHIIVIDKTVTGKTPESAISTTFEYPVMAIIPFDTITSTTAEEKGIPAVISFPKSYITACLKGLADKVLEITSLKKE